MQLVNGRLCMSQETASAMIQADIDRQAECDKASEAARKTLELEQSAHAATRKERDANSWWQVNGLAVAAGASSLAAVAAFMAGFFGGKAVK